MRIVKPGFEVLTPFDADLLHQVEHAGRTCYKSEANIDGTIEGAAKFVQMLIDKGHHAMLEHGPAISVKFVCDRGVSHEIVRHRLFSFAQESTRYCNYAKDKFGKQVTVIDPGDFMTDEQIDIWNASIMESEAMYFELIEAGAKPQMARSVLPNSLKTEIVVTGNPREWRHFFTMRAERHAHPQMRQLACPLLADFRERVPVIFDDVGDPHCEET